jgi:hypothetical protein
VQANVPLFNPSKLSEFDIPIDNVALANKGINDLRTRLVDKIDCSSILPGLLISSSVQMFFQGHVRRALMFIEGGYDAFLAGRGLVVFACARAVYETFACVCDFCDKLTERLNERNFEKSAAFVSGRIFSTRIQDLVKKETLETEIMDNTSVNILTQIERLSKSFTWLKGEYELLSERTHPNGLGSVDYFWSSGEDVVIFSNGDIDQDHVARSLVGAGRLLAIMDDRMKVLERELAKVPALWWKNARSHPPRVHGAELTKAPKVGRNDPCPCGSGKKFKACCLAGT